MSHRICNPMRDVKLGLCARLTAYALAVSAIGEVAWGYGAPAQVAAPVRSAAPYQAAPPVGSAAAARSFAPAQATAPIAAKPAPLPEAIYWRQHLFLIPYQWGSAAESGVAQSVWLFVSKDRGASWRKISEAKPDVKAFNYRAEGDGEYWFAVRTIDKQGRA